MRNLVAVLVIQLAVLVKFGFLFDELLAPYLFLFCGGVASSCGHVLPVFMQVFRESIKIHGFLRQSQQLFIVVHPLD